MTPNVLEEVLLLRAEIAAAAARLIAQDGADYNSAKRKAARQILGDTQPPPNLLPDNAQIEAEVRIYQSLFHADTQPARLFRLRTLAVDIMEGLSAFHPFLTGAVLNGTAGPHDDIHLQLFADSAKEVEIFLLNRNLQIDISETPHFKGATVRSRPSASCGTRKACTPLYMSSTICAAPSRRAATASRCAPTWPPCAPF
jgi:hypothetical protein